MWTLRTPWISWAGNPFGFGENCFHSGPVDLMTGVHRSFERRDEKSGWVVPALGCAMVVAGNYDLRIDEVSPVDNGYGKDAGVRVTPEGLATASCGSLRCVTREGRV